MNVDFELFAIKASFCPPCNLLATSILNVPVLDASSSNWMFSESNGAFTVQILSSFRTPLIWTDVITDSPSNPRACIFASSGNVFPRYATSLHRSSET